MNEDTLPSSTAEGCASCGNSAVEKGYPTPLCHDCRQRFIKFPIPRLILVFAGIIGVVIIVSLFSFPKHLSTALHFEKGERAMKKRQYHTAQIELTEFIRDAPDNQEARGYLAIAAFYNNDLTTVFEQGKKIADEDLGNDKLVRELNSIAGYLEEYYPGDSLRLLTRRNPDSTDDVPDSLLVPYASRHPEEVYTLMVYASHLYDEGRYATCDSVLRIALRKDPYYLPGLRLNFGVQRELGNYPASIKSCDDILTVNSEASYAIAGKARTFLKQHDDKKALQLALEAVKVDAKDLYTACTLVLARHYNGQMQERDALIRSLKAAGDPDLPVFLGYAEDVIAGKEKFRN
jgi:hypothetical protein